MNRNVSIVVVILVLVVIAGYLVWLRSRVTSIVAPKVTEQTLTTPTPTPTMTASPSATPSGREATGGAKQKSATPGATKR